MIKRVRKKFILVAMIATTVVTLLLIFAINLFNAIQVNQELDRALQEISHVKTRAGEPEQQGETGGLKGHKDGKKDRRAASTKYEGRFFTMLLKDGQFYFQNGEEISEEIESFGEAVIESGKTAGTIDDYRFLATETGDVTVISFLDCTTEIQGERNLLMISAAVGCAGILLSFFFILLMSGKIILPLKESMEKQKRFITDAGHELKTPLSVIGTNMDILSMDLGENEWVEGTKKQVKKLNGLVRHLISLSRLEETEQEADLQPFDISAAALESAAPFQAKAEMEGKEMELSVEGNLQAVGDEGSVRQLFTILCDNAVQYSTGEKPILVKLYLKGKSVCFETVNPFDPVHAPEDLNRLFDRFYRGDLSRSEHEGKAGYGLGLSIAQEIAKKNRIILSVAKDGCNCLVFSARIHGRNDFMPFF